MNQCKLAQVANPDGTGGGGGVNTQKSPLPRSTVSVQSSGEMWTHPDILQFTITIRNSKASLEEAKTSVKRRTDYIAQVIRKNGTKSGSIVVSTDVSRAGSSVAAGVGGFSDPGACSGGIPQAGLATVQTEIVVSCNSIEKCETIRNVLIEKLDTSVEISPVTFWHTAGAKEKGRQEAFKRAVTSAKAKAECITQTVGVHLGPAIEVKEVQQDCVQGSAAVVGEGMDLESLQSTGLHRRHVNASMLFTSQVAICFETQPARLCNHKKCRKHWI